MRVTESVHVDVAKETERKMKDPNEDNGQGGGFQVEWQAY